MNTVVRFAGDDNAMHAPSIDGIDVPAAWTRLDRETAAAFSYFVVYRDLGPTRTLSAVARKCGLHEYSLTVLAKRNLWRGRAEAWDAHLDAIRLARQIEQIREMEERHADVAVKIQDKIISRLDSMSDEEIKRISHQDIVRWATASADMERQARRGRGGREERGTRVQINNVNKSSSSASASVAVQVAEITETIVCTREQVAMACQSPKGELVGFDRSMLPSPEPEGDS